MHLVGPHLTTNSNSKKSKLSKSKKQSIASQQHEDWLRKQGLLPEQIEKRMGATKPDYAFPDLKVQNSTALSNNLAVKGGFRHGIMDNLQNETPEVQEEILAKAKRIAPGWNKGGYIFITDDTNLSDLGKKK